MDKFLKAGKSEGEEQSVKNYEKQIVSVCDPKILASYNDEDKYLFDSETEDTATYLHHYRGHRDSQNALEVKGVNFYGPQSEYIISGSDCTHIFFWEKQTENIVNYIRGGILITDNMKIREERGQKGRETLDDRMTWLLTQHSKTTKLM